jgi:hypothetical protein
LADNRLLGVVLNAVDPRDAHSSYYYYSTGHYGRASESEIGSKHEAEGKKAH